MKGGLNLKPGERRLLVLVGVALFAVVNIWLVWPHFGDWKKVKGGIEDAQTKLGRYRQRVAQMPAYEKQLKTLEGQGVSVELQDQEIKLLETVQAQAAASRIEVSNWGDVSQGTSTEFFEEKTLRLMVNTNEKELIDFLVKLGQSGSMIRVRDLSLQPADSNRYRLKGTIVLTAHYQRPPAAGATAPAKPAAQIRRT